MSRSSTSSDADYDAAPPPISDDEDWKFSQLFRLNFVAGGECACRDDDGAGGNRVVHTNWWNPLPCESFFDDTPTWAAYDASCPGCGLIARQLIHNARRPDDGASTSSGGALATADQTLGWALDQNLGTKLQTIDPKRDGRDRISNCISPGPLSDCDPLTYELVHRYMAREAERYHGLSDGMDWTAVAEEYAAGARCTWAYLMECALRGSLLVRPLALNTVVPSFRTQMRAHRANRKRARKARRADEAEIDLVLAEDKRRAELRSAASETSCMRQTGGN
jgi:hypothetical protein